MKVVRSIEELRQARRGQERVGFVPTMGAFHRGHLQLMQNAKDQCGFAIVSLFVNPIQFAPTDDLAKYPRDEARDCQLAEENGVDVMFIPTIDELTKRLVSNIQVSGPALGWEGDERPGHFNGVATIVAKLFNIVQPTHAFFGLKDLQQCAVIRTLVDDFDYPIQLEFAETVRESDGLAMSSRNAYFEPETRKLAARFPTLLRVACEQIMSGQSVDESLAKCEQALAESSFGVDYLAVVDPATMQRLDSIDRESRLIAAVRFHGVRLIDNWPIHHESS